ncbi:hypothetical protein GTO91_09055 [Heliobacterium undosum]|uniref:Uncharacterized protein n=1 Tax=Heliomicrobium undosum TaxID=121734 RepID=A0A845L4S7_9FIRM|nr:hypothetical protein [Heliomicrobium undosum]MZP29854.1 hypothetical protein [Heliomicrobium undosum]
MKSPDHGKSCDSACHQAFRELIVAFASEEKSLASLLEAEAARAQAAAKNAHVGIDQFIELNRSIREILSALLKREVLMQLKLDLLLRWSADTDKPEEQTPLLPTSQSPQAPTVPYASGHVVSTVPSKSKPHDASFPDASSPGASLSDASFPYASFPSGGFPPSLFAQRADSSPPIVVRFLVGKKRVRLAKKKDWRLPDKE